MQRGKVGGEEDRGEEGREREKECRGGGWGERRVTNRWCRGREQHNGGLH